MDMIKVERNVECMYVCRQRGTKIDRHRTCLPLVEGGREGVSYIYIYIYIGLEKRSAGDGMVCVVCCSLIGSQSVS